MQEVPTHAKCIQCGGTGQQPITGPTGSMTTIPCTWPGCVNGSIEIGCTDLEPGLNDVMDKLNDIFEKVNDIKAKVDTL